MIIFSNPLVFIRVFIVVINIYLIPKCNGSFSFREKLRYLTVLTTHKNSFVFLCSVF